MLIPTAFPISKMEDTYYMNKYQYLNFSNRPVWGFALGDALGVPFEFYSSEDIKKIDIYHIFQNKTFLKSHPTVPLGTWSDDTSQLLILLESLIRNNGLDLIDLSKKLINWKNDGYMAINNYTFDIGIQTYNALNNIENSGLNGLFDNISEYGNGNGSLMRVLALAVYSKTPDPKLVIDAHYQSYITHPHMRSQVCCAIYAMWARYLIRGMSPRMAWYKSIDIIFLFYREYYQSKALEELDIILSFDDMECSGTGYVVDTLQTVKKILFNCNSYVDVVLSAIQMGNDTDTVAALSGGVAAIVYGLDSVPDEWWDHLRGKLIIERVLSGLD